MRRHSHLAAVPASMPDQTHPPTDAELIAALRRDLKSAHVRNRMLIRELVRATGAPKVRAVLPGYENNVRYVAFYDNGIILELKFHEDGEWKWVQTATIPGSTAAIVDGAVVQDLVRESAEFTGLDMAVIL